MTKNLDILARTPGFLRRAPVGPVLLAGMLVLLAGAGRQAYAWLGATFPHATVKVWDTAVPIPPSLSLGLGPGESVEDPGGRTGHGTGAPTVITVYAQGSHPLGPSGVSYWNPDANVFVWYGKTLGYPSGVDINRGGPVQGGGPLGTWFGPGDVWVAGQQNEPLYVQIAGTNAFRTYGAEDPFTGPSGKVWGIEVDETTGDVFAAQPDEGRVSRLEPATARVSMWLIGGQPAYVTVDGAGRPYTTLSASDQIARVNPGPDGAFATADDSVSIWNVPSLNGVVSFRRVPPLLPLPPTAENPNGLITADAAGDIWFAESNSNEVGRLGAGADGILGTADDQICEYTTAGLANPQQIATSGLGTLLQAFFTEGDGNSMSLLTPVEADRGLPPARTCTTVPAQTFIVAQREAITRHFDEEVPPLRTAIVPTVHDVAGTGAPPSGGTTTAGGEPLPPILRFSPMPNPILSVNGTPIGDAGNGYPSGMTGVYAANRVAGAYLRGNKCFELTSSAVLAGAPPSPAGVPGRMTGGGSVFTADGRRVTHGFVIHCATGQKGNDVLQVNWGDGNRFHLESLATASCSDDPAIGPYPPAAGFDTLNGSGTGEYNGQEGAAAEWTFTDAGEPGVDDTARIVIRDAAGNTVLIVSGRLQKGNQQAHAGSQ